MKCHAKRKQQGYLLIVACMLIVVIGFIGLMLTRMFTNQAQTSSNQLQAKQALYLAMSGLDIAKRDVTINSVACNGTLHNAENLLGGQFTVTGTLSNPASTTLNGSITASSTSLMLTSTVGFAPKGIVLIDSEYIYYNSLSGNLLSQLTRSKGPGGVASAHASGAVASQNQCQLQSTGYEPTAASFSASQSVSAVLWINLSLNFGGTQPMLATTGTVTFNSSSSITNTGVIWDGTTGNPPNGANIATNGGTVTFNKSSSGTYLNDGSGGPQLSSNKSLQRTDIYTSVPAGTSLMSSYFGSLTAANLQSQASAAGHSLDPSKGNLFPQLNGVNGSVIYINGNWTENSDNATSGTTASPSVLYINGNLTLNNSNLVIYGIIYVNGTLTLNSTSTLMGEGSIAATGDVTLNKSGNTISMYLPPNDSVLSKLFSTVIPGGGSKSYVTQSMGVQEVYP